MKLFKKLNSKGFGHLEVIVLVAVVVVLAAVGGFVYEHNHNKAHAGGWTYIAHINGVGVYGCTNYVNAYGGVYKTTVLFSKSSNIPNYAYTVVDQRGASTVSSVSSSSYWANEAGEETVNLSSYYGDTLEVRLSNSNWYDWSIRSGVNPIPSWAGC